MNTPFNPLTAPVVATPSSVSANALAQRESVRMQAAMLLALTYPRDEEVSLKRLLKACQRPELAEEAIYEYARGGTKISGPTIRLAEEMQRCWGHILCGVEETRGATSSEWRSFAWDLETLSGDEKLFTVRHWRDTKQGGYVLTDERDIYEVGANMAARRKRACILACIPQYIQDAAEAACRHTLEQQVQITAERIQTMLDSFTEFGVTKEMIEKRLQRNLEAITPSGMVLMRNIYNSLRDGVGKPADFFETSAAADADAGKSQTRTEKVKETLRGRQAAAEGANKTARKPPPEKAPTEGQGQMPFYDEKSALDVVRATNNAKVAALIECWKGIFKDFTSTHRTLPHSVSMEALRRCMEVEDVTALWNVMATRYRDADLELPLEVEAVFHEQVETLEQRE